MQASWNLCPQSGGSGCYNADDQTFASLTGSSSVVIPDCPDGDWVLQVSSDTFDKVRGAVRILPLLQEQALADKVGIALAVAAAQRATEAAVLEAVVAAGHEAPLQVLNASLAGAYEGQLAQADENLQEGVWNSTTYQANAVLLGQAWE